MRKFVRRATIMGTMFILSAVLFFMGTASASLLYYETFNGTAGDTLTAYDPGYTGTGTAAMNIAAPGLSRPGQESSGNSLYINQPASGTTSKRHVLTSPLPYVGTFFASAMFKVDSISSAWYRIEIPLIQTTAPTTGVTKGFGINSTSTTFPFAFNSVTNGIQSLGSYGAGSTVQIVEKYDYNSVNHTMTMFAALNPTPAGEPSWTSLGTIAAPSSGDWAISSFGVFSQSSFGIGGPVKGWIDEIRIATTYSEAVAAPVPIPAAAWLLGSGLVGLVALKRKFQR